jgi:hypothetical protein
VNAERAAGIVRRWVRLYTRDLPHAVAQRRIEEIDADVRDHITHERAGGTSERRIALGIVSRMTRGFGADAAWHVRQAKASGRPAIYRSIMRVAVVVTFILLLPLVAMRFTDQVVWTLADFVVVGVLLATIGFALELAVRKAGSLTGAIGIGVLGLFAGFWGRDADAPGLVLIGLVLVASACSIAVRRLQRSR